MVEGYKVIHRINNTQVHVAISPCSWSYADYGFELVLILEDDNMAFLNRSVKFINATYDDIEEMLSTVKIIKCACGRPTFDPKTVVTNKKYICNSCYEKEKQCKSHKMH